MTRLGQNHPRLRKLVSPWNWRDELLRRANHGWLLAFQLGAETMEKALVVPLRDQLAQERRERADIEEYFGLTREDEGPRLLAVAAGAR